MTLSLYRKYRPNTFSDVVGQEHIETTLQNAIQTNSVSHAYLFCGPRGTGKTTTARLLAKALLCEKAPTAEPCGVCLECREIAGGMHPDVYELDAASRTGVDNVREEIIGRVQFAPTRGKYKIYIIDEVHMLSTAAFNALLKVIEEPPPHVIFVLCTTDPHKVLDTIKSRCQQFEFHRLSEADVARRLEHICTQEGYQAEPEAIALIAQRCAGGMRDAISSLEQLAVFTAGNITFAAAESMLGEVSGEQLFSVSALLAARDIGGCFAWVASFTQSGTDIAQFVRDLAAHMRNIYVAAVLGNSAGLGEIISSDTETLQRYIEHAGLFGSVDRLSHALLVLGELSTQMRYSANARLALEIALTRIARPSSDLSMESLAARIAVLEQGGVAVAAAGSNVAEQLAAEGGAAASAPSSSSAVATSTPPLSSAVVANAPTSSSAVVANTPPSSAEPPSNTNAAQSEPPSNTESPSNTNAAQSEQTKGLDEGGAHRLWTQVIRQLQADKKMSLATFLSGSSAHHDAKTDGLKIELPKKSTFALQNLEKPENRESVQQAIKKVHGKNLPLAYKLGTEDAPASKVAGSAQGNTSQSAQQTSAPATGVQSPSIPGSTGQQQGNSQEQGSEQDMSFEDILSASFGTSVSVDSLDDNN